MKVEPATRRANLLVFIGLVVFAIALCVLILLWMRARTHAMGGTVYPPTTLQSFRQPAQNTLARRSSDGRSFAG